MIDRKTDGRRIIIMDGDQRSALAATRALGAAGFEVFVGANQTPSLAGSSKHATDQFTYPDPAQFAEAACNAILNYATEIGADCLAPMTDVSTHLLHSEPRFDTYCCISPPRVAYETASDKHQLMEIASRCGLETPNSYLVDSTTPIQELPPTFSFPVAMKPTRSRIATGSGYVATTVVIAHDKESLIAAQLENPWFTEHPWILQSFVEGKGQGVFSIYDSGRPVAWFAHERIREKPPTGGVSVLSRSAALSPRLKEAAKSLLDALQWHGPAMVEFRVTADGTPYLMEINARFWGSLQLAISAGVNFPRLATEIALGEHPEPVMDYKIGACNRWLLGDLDNLYLTLKSPARDFTIPQKLAAIGKFIIPWWPGLHYEVNQWGDLGPFWHEMKHYLR